MSAAVQRVGVAPSGGHLLGAGAVILAGLCWSAGGLFFRLLESTAVWPILTWRFGAVALFFAFYILLKRRGRLFAFWSELGWRAPAGGLLFAGASLFFIFALSYTTVFNALVMLSIQPLLAAGLAWIFRREPVRPVTWIAMVLAVAGIAVMVWDSLESGGFFGNLLALGSSVCFAGYTVFNRAIGARDTAPLVMIGGLIGMVLSLGMSLASGFDPLLSLEDVGLCFAMGWLHLGFGFILFNFGSRLIPSAEALVLAQTEIIFGPLWVWLAFGEEPTAFALWGGLVLFAAVLLQAGEGLRRHVRVIPPPAAQP